MAFKGRKNIVILGDIKAGYTTVHKGFKINDEAFMNVSVGYGKERKGKTYRNATPPDIPRHMQ